MFKTSNNQAEYEASGVQKLIIKGDSQLVIGEVKGKSQGKELQLRRYLAQVKKVMGDIKECIMEYIPNEQNS